VCRVHAGHSTWHLLYMTPQMKNSASHGSMNYILWCWCTSVTDIFLQLKFPREGPRTNHTQKWTYMHAYLFSVGDWAPTGVASPWTRVFTVWECMLFTVRTWRTTIMCTPKLTCVCGEMKFWSSSFMSDVSNILQVCCIRCEACDLPRPHFVSWASVGLLFEIRWSFQLICHKYYV